MPARSPAGFIYHEFSALDFDLLEDAWCLVVNGIANRRSMARRILSGTPELSRACSGRLAELMHLLCF